MIAESSDDNKRDRPNKVHGNSEELSVDIAVSESLDDGRPAQIIDQFSESTK